MKVRDENYSVKDRPCASITSKKHTLRAEGGREESFTTDEGHFNFEGGTVTIYQSEFRGKDGKYIPYASFSFYYNGRGYHRTITGKHYTHLGLARKAGEFGRQVIKKVGTIEGKLYELVSKTIERFDSVGEIFIDQSTARMLIKSVLYGLVKEDEK